MRPRRIRRPATHRPLPALPAQRVADLDDRVRSLGHSAQPEPPSLLAPPADQPTVPASPGAAAPARPSVIGTAPSTDPLLPAPPTDGEKYWYLGGQKRWYPLAGAAAFVGIGISMTKFALSQPTLSPFLALLTFTVLCHSWADQLDPAAPAGPRFPRGAGAQLVAAAAAERRRVPALRR